MISRRSEILTLQAPKICAEKSRQHGVLVVIVECLRLDIRAGIDQKIDGATPSWSQKVCNIDAAGFFRQCPNLCEKSFEMAYGREMVSFHCTRDPFKLPKIQAIEVGYI